MMGEAAAVAAEGGGGAADGEEHETPGSNAPHRPAEEALDDGERRGCACMPLT